MITINRNRYRLVLLDTNALSEFAKRGESFRSFLMWSSAEPTFVPCFSLFSVLEMRRRPDVYGGFKELFRVLPCMLMKSHEQLLEEEVRCYPDPSRIDPTLLAFRVLGGDGMDLVRVLDETSEDESFAARRSTGTTAPKRSSRESRRSSTTSPQTVTRTPVTKYGISLRSQVSRRSRCARTTSRSRQSRA